MNVRALPLGWLIGAVVLLALIAVPLIIGSAQLALPIEVLIFALFALTYDVMFGFTGLISFGHALFVGMGAYTMAVCLTTHQTSLLVAIVVTLISGIIISAVTGVLALRTRGVYFAMITLAFAQAAFLLAQSNVGDLTHGEDGLLVQGAPDWLVGPGNQAHFYYVALACLVAGFLLLRLFVSSPAGSVWQAIRENEQRALMIGYRPYSFKLLSYVISGTICTLAGGLYALSVVSISPGTVFSADLTIQLLLMVIIGGAGSLWGAMLGAGILRYLVYYLNKLPEADWVTHLPNLFRSTLGQPLLIFGVIYLLLIYFFPQGIAGLVQKLRVRFAAAPALPVGLGELEAEAAVAGVEDVPPPETQSTTAETIGR